MQDKSLRHIKDYRYFFFLAVLQFYSAAVLQFGSVNELNAPNALSFLLSNSQLLIPNYLHVSVISFLKMGEWR